LILFDLCCRSGHVFEGWFQSSAAFGQQLASGLVKCPLCDDPQVQKAVMAPAVGAKSNRQTDSSVRKDTLQQLAQWQSNIEANCDYVGQRFAEEARRRHADAVGDLSDRGLYGETSIKEAAALIEEGIPVAPLPFRSRRSADA